MLKKFVSSLMVMVLLTGCSAASKSTSVTAEVSAVPSGPTAADEAAEIVKDLSLEETTEQAKDRVVLGMLFNGDKEVCTDSALYLSSTSNCADTVGVFVTSDIDTCKGYLNDYLSTQKASAETYSPEEVFKISNAIVEDNGSTVVMIVCDDIEQAKKCADSILNK